jgi:hypothetical protein
MPPVSTLTLCFTGEDLFGLPLRASNEHIPIVRVPRAQEINRPPSRSLLCEQEGRLVAPLPIQKLTGSHPRLKGTHEKSSR